MRRRCLAAVVFSMVMACAMPAYANEADAVAAYREMEEKTSSMTDLDAYYDFRLDVSYDGKQSGGRLEMNIKTNRLNDPENLKLNAYMRLTADPSSFLGAQSGPGEAEALAYDAEDLTMTGSFYYADNMYYMDMMGTKLKMAMPLSSMMTDMQSAASLSHYSEELMQNMTLRTEGDIRIVSFSMNQEYMDEIMDQMMKKMGMSSLGDMGITVRFRDISGEYEINPEGYYIKSREKITMDMTYDGKTITMVLDGDVGIANPGQPVSIQAPNLAEYTLVEQ